MPLETATYVSQLVSSNPAATDTVGQGDDHLRLIKSVLLATLPNWTAVAMQSTQTQIDAACLNAGSVSPTSGTFLVPPGAITHYGGATAPTGWLLCDGSAYSTTTYAALFAVLGYTYGGSGSSFNVPDAQGRVLASIDSATLRLAGSDMGGLGLGAVGGEPTHTLVLTEMPYHTHSASDSGHVHTDAGHNHTATSTDSGHQHAYTGTWINVTLTGSSFGWLANEGDQTTAVGYASVSTTVHTGYASIEVGYASIYVSYAGASTAHNNVQPTLIVNTIIKT